MIVRVPATTANVGPGFDVFGLAWQLYNELEFIPGGEGLNIIGCDKEFANRDNLAYSSYVHVLKMFNLQEEGLTIRFLRCDVPIARGLGSSSTLIVAGIAAANSIHRLGMTRERMLEIASEIEGHPDNVAPAILGGFTASAIVNGKVVGIGFSVSSNLRFTAVIPDFKVSTTEARRVLPASYSREDAIFNLSRSALLVKSLNTGDLELLSSAMQDRIHEPFRSKLIPHYEEVRTAAFNCGAAGFCISGAAPTMICISGDDTFTQRMKENVASFCPGWQVMSLLPDRIGVRSSDFSL